MGLEEEIFSMLREAGDLGATASQIARRLGRKREVVSHYLWILKKAGKVTNRGRNLWVLERVLDPFNMPLRKFENLSFDEYVSMAERAYELCKEKIKETFRDDSVHHVVVCNGEVVHKADNPAGIDGHLLRDLMTKMGKPCYVLSREDLAEEARWTQLNDDYYPTVELLLGGKEWTDDNVAEKGRKILADFDTGNPYYTIFGVDYKVKVMRHQVHYQLAFSTSPLPVPCRFRNLWSSIKLLYFEKCNKFSNEMLRTRQVKNRH